MKLLVDKEFLVIRKRKVEMFIIRAIVNDKSVGNNFEEEKEKKGCS
jgi:hypothetical protein